MVDGASVSRRRHLLRPVTKIQVGFELQDVKTKLASDAPGKTWDELARIYGVNKGTLWRIVHDGYEPKRPAIRAALGLPPILRLSPGAGVEIAEGTVVLRSSRPCACRCGATFIPNSWNHRWLPGHRKHR